MTKPDVLAIVQARGGSKSVPRKNLKELGGYPLVAYSIAAGLQAELVDRVIVSTDDGEIARVSRQFGAEVPFMRPAEYAQDLSYDFDLFFHALTWMEENEGYTPEIIVQLRPTSPFRPPDCLDSAIRRLIANPEATSVRGVVPSGQIPYRIWRITDENSPMIPILTDHAYAEPSNIPRQELPTTYWQTGHIDVIRRDVILKDRRMSGDKILPLVIDERYAIDIDTLYDWEQAEWMIEWLDIDYVKP